MKCINCGKEFEGNFCPVCGTKSAPRTCPQCGKTRAQGERFCSNCGYSFIQQPQAKAQQMVHSSAPNQKIASYLTKAPVYKIFKLLPTILFAMFSVLLFIFFATPVAIMPGGEILGETIPSESYGNVYSMVSEVPSLKGALIALIIFAVMALVLATVLVIAKASPKFKTKQISVIGRSVDLGTILTFAAYIFYLIFFIIGCATCGTISSEDGGLGIISAGACPILIIVFSLLFLIISIIAMLICAHANKLSELQALGADEKQILYTEQSSIANEQEQKRLAQYFATHNAPVPPQAVKKPQKNEQLLREKKTIQRCMIIRVAFNCLFLLILMFVAVCLLDIDTTINSTGMSAMFIIGMVAYWAILAYTVIYLCVGIRAIKNLKLKIIRKRTISLIIEFLIAVFLTTIMIAQRPYLDAVYFLFINIALCCILAILIFVYPHTRKNALLSAYDTKKPEKEQKPVITVDDIENYKNTYRKQEQEYKDYLKKVAEYEHDLELYNKGKLY